MPYWVLNCLVQAILPYRQIFSELQLTTGLELYSLRGMTRKILLSEALEIMQDLVTILDALESRNESIACQGQPMDGFSALYNFRSVAEKARSLIEWSKDGQEG